MISKCCSSSVTISLKLLLSPHLPDSIQTLTDQVFSMLNSDSSCWSIWVLYAQIDLLLHFSSKMETAFWHHKFCVCFLSGTPLSCRPFFFPQTVLWWHIKIYAEASSSLEKANPKHLREISTQGDENLCFKIVAKPIVCKMMIKQKLLRTINHHFLTLMSLVILTCYFQKKTFCSCTLIYSSSIDAKFYLQNYLCWILLKSNDLQARKDLAFYQWEGEFWLAGGYL